MPDGIVPDPTRPLLHPVDSDVESTGVFPISGHDAIDDSLELKKHPAIASPGADNILPLPVLTSTTFTHAAVRNDQWQRSSRSIPDEEPLHLPLRIKRALLRLATAGKTGRVWRWLHGPQPSRELTIHPLPYIRHVEAYFDRLFRDLRSPLILFPFLFLWLVGLAELSKLSTFSAMTSAGAPSYITGSSSFWSPNAQCGLNGTECEPFSGAAVPFRCPAKTVSVQLLNNRAVGPEEVIFQPLIVGGGDADATYRADSFICQSAIHYGLFTDANGGCGVVNQIGSYADFVAVDRNGLTSTPFASIFPSAYRFSPVAGSKCDDLSDEILVYNVILMFTLSFVLRPPTVILFWATICSGFWHVALTLATSVDDISVAFGTFLPTLFFAYALWRCTFRWLLPHFNIAILERSILFYAGYWVSVVSYETWERLPLQRLLPQDISKQPGALATVIVLIIVIALCVIVQLWTIWKTGWLPYYLTCYAVGGICVGLLATVPNMTFRLHHYVAALVLLPLTAFPSRISLICAGLLLGLFISGAAEWGFDAILQTASQLRGDAAQGTTLPSFANTSTTFDAAAKLLAFTPIPANMTSISDGYALIIDDVLQQQGAAMSYDMSVLDRSYAHFFRLAYTFNGTIGDFTRAASWYPSNGTWIDPQAGPS